MTASTATPRKRRAKVETMNVSNFLARAAKARGVAEKKGLHREIMANSAEDIHGFALVAAEGDWLYSFLHKILVQRAQGKQVTPLEVHGWSADAIVSEGLRKDAESVKVAPQRLR